MPTLKEIFDAIEHAKVFNTQDLKSRYHQLPIKEVDKQKIAFWGIDEHGKNNFLSMVIIAIWVEKCHSRIPKNHGQDFSRVGLCLMLH